MAYLQNLINQENQWYYSQIGRLQQNCKNQISPTIAVGLVYHSDATLYHIKENACGTTTLLHASLHSIQYKLNLPAYRYAMGSKPTGNVTY